MKTALTLSGLVTALSALPALAQDGLEIVGEPHPGGVGFQAAATDLARAQQGLDHLLLSPNLAPRLLAAGVDRDEEGNAQAELDDQSDDRDDALRLRPEPERERDRRAQQRHEDDEGNERGHARLSA